MAPGREYRVLMGAIWDYPKAALGPHRVDVSHLDQAGKRTSDSFTIDLTPWWEFVQVDGPYPDVPDVAEGRALNLTALHMMERMQSIHTGLPLRDHGLRRTQPAIVRLIRRLTSHGHRRWVPPYSAPDARVGLPPATQEALRAVGVSSEDLAPLPPGERGPSHDCDP
jgi:hypothetical protein